MIEDKHGNDDRDIAKRSYEAAGLVLVVQFLSQLILVVLGICLARILTPEDYGIIGMLTIFWALSNSFIGGGFTHALVQRKKVSEVDLCSVFYYNVFLSLVCAGIVIAFSHKIAVFYNQPILEKTINISAWVQPIGAFCAVQQVLLERRLKQFLTTISTLVSHIVAAIIAIILAKRGLGVWAIVWQQFFAALLTSISIFFCARWVPKLCFSFKALGSLFSYGSKLLIVSILNNTTLNLSNVVVGKRYDADTLGFYTRAKFFANLWPISVQGAISKVLFAAFSKIQDDPLRLRAAFERSLGVSTFAVVFVPFLLCTLCRPFIILVLGEKWLPCIPYWWLITFVVFFYPIQELNIQLLKARGRSGTFLMIEIIKKGLMVAQFVVLFWRGIYEMLLCEIIFTFSCVVISAWIAGRDIQFGFWRQFRVFFPYVLITIPSCFFSWELYYFISSFSPWGALFFAAFIGCFLYLLLNRLFKTSAFLEIVQLLGGRFPLLKRFFFL